MLFENCAIHRSLHKKMFAGQKLESFTYMPNVKATQTINAGASFSEPQLTETLGQSRQTMREMVIYPTKRSEQPRIQEYTCLQSLEIPIFVLLTSLRELEDFEEEVALCFLRCLPRSLQSIDLRCWQLEDLTEIAVLQMEGRFSNLQHVRIMFMPTGSSEVKGQFESNLEAVMKKAGIELEVV